VSNCTSFVEITASNAGLLVYFFNFKSFLSTWTLYCVFQEYESINTIRSLNFIDNISCTPLYANIAVPLSGDNIKKCVTYLCSATINQM
jgi:hypothetical protein